MSHRRPNTKRKNTISEHSTSRSINYSLLLIDPTSEQPSWLAHYYAAAPINASAGFLINLLYDLASLLALKEKC